MFKSTNQQGRAPWSDPAHVTFRLNHIRGAEMGTTISGSPESRPAVKANTFLIEHNLIETTQRRIFQFAHVADLTARRNTATGMNHAVSATNPLARLTFVDNLIRSGAYAFHGLNPATAGTDTADATRRARRPRGKCARRRSAAPCYSRAIRTRACSRCRRRARVSPPSTRA